MVFISKLTQIIVEKRGLEVGQLQSGERDKRLSEIRRICCVLSRKYGRSVKEIADFFGMTAKGVASTLAAHNEIMKYPDELNSSYRIEFEEADKEVRSGLILPSLGDDPLDQPGTDSV